MLAEIPPAPGLIAALAFVLGGHLALARSMRRNHGRLWGAPPPRSARFAWRMAGAAEFLAAYVACILGWGVSVGFVVCLGLGAMAGLCVVFGLTYAPRAARLAAFAAPAVALAILAAALS